ncbi:MAG: Choloyl-CoA hydrolase, partial [Ilumatobacteraceae bacterium]|nr:Choloyl-CoA hydrolase [Ilumatobacteraceae bacterium]
MQLSMVERLALVEQPGDEFVSSSPTDRRHVFGGLLIGQALRAAQLTVDPVRLAHSLHASFVVAGTGAQHVRYEVERTRDGGSFSTRRVVARQERGVVLVMTADFHDDEPGLEYELPASAGVPMPEDLEPGRYESRWFDARDVPVDAASGAQAHARRAWFRPTAPVPADPRLHLQVLAYLSDHGPTRAARQPHADLDGDGNRMSVSLDHSVWFHRPVDVNSWLLSELMPVATGRGRGLSIGTIRTRDGSLVATVAQEVLLRSL